MDTRTKEAVRYLGYGRSAVDEPTLRLIHESFEELEKIADVKFVYRIFELSFLNEEELRIGKITVKSKSLGKNLVGCETVYLLGITLGAEVDRRLKRHEVKEMSRAVVFQACAAAYLEEACDWLQERLVQEQKQYGRYLRPRFSPGYGDFSVMHQDEILSMLDTAKQIGLSRTEGEMLIPTKSVTALIGITCTPETCENKSCEQCSKTDCLYRRSKKC